MSEKQKLIPSSRRNPCPVCGRTKDGDCRVSSDGLEVICHHPKDHRPGEVVTGADDQTWAFTANTRDGRAGHFTLDKPRDGAQRFPRRSIQRRQPEPARTQPAPLPDRPPALARMTPSQPGGSPYSYSDTQLVKRVPLPDGDKAFYGFHLVAGRWEKGAGPDPWPVFNLADTIGAHGWILETEGEKCAEIALSEGVVTISQPGHARTIEQIVPRYQGLKAGGCPGVVYLADHDGPDRPVHQQEGRRRAENAAEAAAQAGLPMLVIPAIDLWPGIPDGGSIDDAPDGPESAILDIIEAATEAYWTLVDVERQQEQEQQEAEKPPTFGELLALVLDAVRAGDEDAEMAIRAEIMARFRQTDARITAALFRLLSRQEQENKCQEQKPDYRSIDLSRVTGIDWLLEGFIPDKDQALLYAPAGAGKTTAALAMAFAVTDGAGFLDRATHAPQGNVLLIASDSGTAPLIRSIQEMGRDADPAISDAAGGPRLHVWAHDTEQAAIAWEASLRGCLRLLEFVRREQISLVLIDSCKAVTSKADLNYCDNGQITALLTFFKEVICRHCAVVWVNHDGTAGGEAAGAKAWKEVPSVVHSIEMVPEGMDENGEGGPKGKAVRFNTRLRSWKVRKCRQGTAREFMYRIDEETGCLAVCHTVEVIRDCRAAIVEVLTEAMNNGRASLSSRAIVEELQSRFRYSQGTIRNGLTRVSGGKWPEVIRVPSLRGHYRLAPRLAELLSSNSDPP
jgi:hypothetical protein